MSSIKITPHLFEAFLKCSTKCWLRSSNEPETNNAYAEWFKAKSDSYRIENAKRMLETTLETERAVSPDATKLRTAGWRLAATIHVRTPDDASLDPSTSKDKTQHKTLSESYIHAVERIPSEGRGKPAQFIPIRFIFTNKLGKDDKLLLAFDALILSQVLGREVNFGKIVYGDDHATIAVKTSAMSGAVQKHLDTITTLLGSLTPPDVVLNRHCAECEFEGRCRRIARDNDDLSLLAMMTDKDRKKFRAKGIFTVTQLSYTFDPVGDPNGCGTSGIGIITRSRLLRSGSGKSMLSADRN